MEMHSKMGRVLARSVPRMTERWRINTSRTLVVNSSHSAAVILSRLLSTTTISLSFLRMWCPLRNTVSSRLQNNRSQLTVVDRGLLQSSMMMMACGLRSPTKLACWMGPVCPGVSTVRRHVENKSAVGTEREREGGGFGEPIGHLPLALQVETAKLEVLGELALARRAGTQDENLLALGKGPQAGQASGRSAPDGPVFREIRSTFALGVHSAFPRNTRLHRPVAVRPQRTNVPAARAFIVRTREQATQ